MKPSITFQALVQSFLPFTAMLSSCVFCWVMYKIFVSWHFVRVAWWNTYQFHFWTKVVKIVFKIVYSTQHCVLDAANRRDTSLPVDTQGQCGLGRKIKLLQLQHGMRTRVWVLLQQWRVLNSVVQVFYLDKKSHVNHHPPHFT